MHWTASGNDAIAPSIVSKTGAHAMTAPVLTFGPDQLGRRVVTLGSKMVASIEPYQRRSAETRWCHLHLPDLPCRTPIQAANDNAAVETIKREISDWCVGIGWLLPGQSVVCVDQSSNEHHEGRRAGTG